MNISVILKCIFYQATNGQGTLKMGLKAYTEEISDNTSKCIELCVTAPPFQFPHCDFTGIAKATFKGQYFTVKPKDFEFKFSDSWKVWFHCILFKIVYVPIYIYICVTFSLIHTIFTLQDNTVLTATVWRLEEKQSCKTRPTNCTHYGDASMIIPYAHDPPQAHMEGSKWKLRVKTFCAECSRKCIPQDSITGHYTCNDGNKRCMKNWFGEECTTFCNVNASNYRCDKHGRKTCLPNWFNKDCDQFCDSSLGNYVCDKAGHQVCLLHWYGKNCTKYCNNSAEKYKCNDNGEKVCTRDWYGQNCSKFCHSNNRSFECSLNGDKICRKNWFGKECSKYCSSNDLRYKCDDKGEKVCLKDWYGHDCLKFCDSSNEAFTCSVSGDKICLKNWFGKDCSKYCNSSETRYKCDDEGGKVCLKDWYGENCTKFCNSTEVRYRCEKKGERVCAENWYGEECDYKQIALSSEIYYLEFHEGKNRTNLGCREGMEVAYCLESCENISKTLEKYKNKCVSYNARAYRAFFCINAKTRNNICTYVQGEPGGEYIIR